jgi:hypothetical protein
MLTQAMVFIAKVQSPGVACGNSGKIRSDAALRAVFSIPIEAASGAHGAIRSARRPRPPATAGQQMNTAVRKESQHP